MHHLGETEHTDEDVALQLFADFDAYRGQPLETESELLRVDRRAVFPGRSSP